MVDIMSEDVSVWEHDAGSMDREVRMLWRKNRQAAYRLGYKDRTGKSHPASKQKVEKHVESDLLKNTDPPKGMDWNDFGILWDLHHEHPYTAVLRRSPVEAQWDAIAAANAEELPV